VKTPMDPTAAHAKKDTQTRTATVTFATSTTGLNSTLGFHNMIRARCFSFHQTRENIQI
jgi:hypothetical protein